jgi:hypothetical protein
MEMRHTTIKTVMNESEFAVSTPVLSIDLCEKETDLLVGVEGLASVFIPKVDSASDLMYTTGPSNPFEYPRNHWFDADGPT